MDNPEKLATLGTQDAKISKPKHNTICAGHHYTQTNTNNKYYFRQYFSHTVPVTFIGGGNECPEKTTDLSQVTDKLYQCCIDYTSSERDSNFSCDSHRLHR